MDRVKQLEEGGMRIPDDFRINESFNLPSSVQANILSIFSDKMKIKWEDFSYSVQAYLNADEEAIESLKYLLTDSEGFADKSLWEHLLKWFCPLYPNGTTFDVSVLTKDEPAYIFQDVLSIVTPTWFFWLDESCRY